MIEKRYLYKRHNVYWVRVRVPNNLRSIIGKTELNKNLYTTNLSEANSRKHKVVTELKQIINLAKRKLDGTLDSLSKEDQVREVALEFRPSSEDDLKNVDTTTVTPSSGDTIVFDSSTQKFEAAAGIDGGFYGS